MITVTIAAVDRTAVIEDITINDNINSQVDTLEFSFIKAPGDTYVPSLNDEIVVTRGAVRIFGGIITSLSNELEGSNIVNYTVTAVDYTFLLNRKLVVERYTDQTINYIISDLVAKYTTGFTIANVFAAITVKSIAFNRITVSECFRKLAELVNYNWYVDYSKDIHFFDANGELAPFTATTGNYIFESLSVKKDITQLRNRVIVQGGEVPSASRTVNHAGNGSTATFATQYKFATRPTVTVGAVPKTVGIDFLDDDALFECMWNFNQKYIRFTAGNIPTTPGSGTNIAFTGNPLLPIVVNVPDSASITIYGESQFAITDKNISTQDQAIDRALAELRAYSGSLSEGKFDTYKAGLRSGQVIRVTDTLRGIDEDFVIQKVRYRFLAANATYDGIWSITLATLKTVGIITVLQKLLLNEDLSVDEQVELLSLFDFTDTVASSDTMSSVTTTSRPYYVGTTAVMGFSTVG